MASSKKSRPARAPRQPAARTNGTTAKAAKSGDAVLRWLAGCRHPLRPVLEALRVVVVSAEPRLVEGIKWNAPSYAFAGDDRITCNLSAPDRVRLIFHCGVRKRAAKGRVPVADRGLLEWAADDRGIATFRSLAEVEAARPALGELVREWLAATTG